MYVLIHKQNVVPLKRLISNNHYLMLFSPFPGSGSFHVPVGTGPQCLLCVPLAPH